MKKNFVYIALTLTLPFAARANSMTPGKYICSSGTTFEMSEDGKSALLKFRHFKDIRLLCDDTVVERTDSYDKGYVKECRIPWSRETDLLVKSRGATSGIWVTFYWRILKATSVELDTQNHCFLEWAE